jgi:tRNA threonylcarbamoyladenosine biosynthesis protein TsaE
MAVIDRGSFEVISRSPEQTRRVGMRLGELLQVGDVIGLEGDLGTGKTTFIQGLASGWGSLDPVSSPSYVLVKVYRRLDKGKLFHLDAYRLSGPEEAFGLDITTMLEEGPLVVEWADRIERALPSQRLWISMRWIAEEQRDFTIFANGSRYEALLGRFREEVYGVV